jgi:predicted CoA-substrate-specific enzyme activase
MRFYRDYCSFDGKVVVDLKKLDIGEVDKAVSTGYGKNNTNLKLFTQINEIKAHTYGAIYQTDLKDFMLLDVGGQDVKVVKVEKGITTDLELNEKCAASCGRYLENMANVLEVSLDEMSKHSKDPVDLNSTCAVFSESELIGKIAEGVEVERLCAGVNYSLYKRLHPLLNKFRGQKLVLTGGVANNAAIKKYLQNDYEEIVSVKEPQFNGAIGCCYYASKFLKQD